MNFSFRPAKRENVGVLLGVMGPTGSGKTYSALRLAKGLSGGQRFAVIDTEAGRAKHYADEFSFDHGDLVAPFRPETYSEAIRVADKAGYRAVVVDSASHVWAGEGGVLDWQEEELERMAGQDFKRREACKMAAWIKPKMAHKQMVNLLLQLRCHLILCFRAEQKIEINRNAETGKIEIVEKVGPTSLYGWTPICEKNLPFEMAASFLLTAEAPGVPKPLKIPKPLLSFFPGTSPLSEESGALVARWAAGGSRVNGAAEADPRPVPPPPPATAGGARIPSGKNEGTLISELDDRQVAWYLAHYMPSSKYADPETHAALLREVERRAAARQVGGRIEEEF